MLVVFVFYGCRVAKRRDPQQARSRQLVASVIEATVVLLRAAPPGEITVAAIAEQAGCSAAGMFRFFADKDAIFAAVAEQLQVSLRKRYVDALHDPGAATLDNAIKVLVDVTASYIRKEPAFRSLRWGAGTPLHEVTRFYRETNRATADALVDRFTELRRNEHRTYLAVEAAGHLIGLAFENHPKGHAATLQIAIEQARLLLNQ